ncbi:MAG TPA: hypothetical protein DDY98_03045 [Ruminococcaceae bacterium]|nr:hypothetical protein [Oscillospiraceae bacterium]
MMNFSDIQINQTTAQLIESAVAANHLPHAVILEGGSEADRLKLARLLARTFLCRSEGNRPCGECADCRKALCGFHPDSTECIAQAGSTDALKVDAIRQIRTDAFVFPNEANHRVFLLHNMQLSNEAAQNALLKILEEPPEYVRFLLTCPTSTALLPTILSRACTYNLGQQVDDNSDETNEKILEITQQIAVALGAPNEFDLMKVTGAFEKDFTLLSPVLNKLQLVLRDALVAKNGGERQVMLSACSREALTLARRFTTARLLEMIRVTNEMQAAINLNANHNLLLTRLCSLLSTAAGK